MGLLTMEELTMEYCEQCDREFEDGDLTEFGCEKLCEECIELIKEEGEG